MATQGKQTITQEEIMCRHQQYLNQRWVARWLSNSFLGRLLLGIVSPLRRAKVIHVQNFLTAVEKLDLRVESGKFTTAQTNLRIHMEKAVKKQKRVGITVTSKTEGVDSGSLYERIVHPEAYAASMLNKASSL